MYKKYFKNFVRIFFYDKHGRVVIGQAPNFPIAAWFVSTVVSMLTKDAYHNSFQEIAHLFLFVWAYLEITSGASLFRKILGAVVMIYLLISTVLAFF